MTGRLATGTFAVLLAAVAAVLLIGAHSRGSPVELYFSPHPPASVPHQSVDQAWADLAAHAPAAPSWLAAAEEKRPAGMAVVDAVHEADPNFPVEMPSAARAATPVERMHSTRQASAKPSAKPSVYESSNSEWQGLRNKMYKAVHVFHKYGDLALEKLLPHRQTAAPSQQKHVVHRQAQAKVQALRGAGQGANSEHQDDGKSKLQLVEENIKLQEKMKRSALKAKEDAKIAAANAKATALAKELRKSQAQDKRELKHIQKEVKGLAEENKRLRRKDASASSKLLEESSKAASKSARTVGQLQSEMAHMRQAESSDISALRQRLAGMKTENSKLTEAVAADKKELKQQKKTENKQMHAVQQQQQHQQQKREVVDAEGDDIRRDDARAMMQDHSPPAPSPLVHLGHTHPATVASRPHRVLRRMRAPRRDREEEREESEGREERGDMEGGGGDSSSFNQHLPEEGFAFTDSSLGCIACISGPDCHSGCRIVPGKPDGVTLRDVALRRKQQRLRQLTHSIHAGHMLKSEEEGGEEGPCADEDGGCSKLSEEGVNVDGWGDDAEAMGAEAAKDPALNAEERREMNQRAGEYAAYDHTKEKGVYTPPSTWGAAARFFGHDNSPGAQKLEKHEVKVDSWPTNIYKGMPLPMFDKSVWDHKKNQGFVMKDALKFNRESNAHMEHAGVLVNKWPSEDFEGNREMPTVDGVADHYVENHHVPQYRATGAAPQEKPVYFLLRDHVNLAAAQPRVDTKKGVETFDEYSMEGHHPGEQGWRTIPDSLGCEPQGCF